MSVQTFEPGERVICTHRLPSVGVVQEAGDGAGGAAVLVQYSFGETWDMADRLIRLEDPEYDALVTRAWRGLELA